MATPAHAVTDERPALWLARQPILTKNENVTGYEVLFLEASDSTQSEPSPARAGSLVDALREVGLDVLCDSRLAFIPCTHQMLLQDTLLSLSSDKVVAMLPDKPIGVPEFEACHRLKARGLRIAIDDFCEPANKQQLLPFADFLRVDARRRAESYSQIAAGHAGKPYKLLLQNVDSRSEFRAAGKAGFALFQGTFFLHPERMQVRQVPAGQTSKLRLLQAISAPEIDFALVEDLIRHDASLCYRLLRYLNSPLLGFSVPVQSVHRALGLLGERALSRWIRTATAMSLGQPKCSDLILSSLVRAHFGELIAARVDHGGADLFLLGMLSLMDAILETPMEVVLEGLALDLHAKAALLAIKNGGGTRLSPICDLMAARERGDWERVAAGAEKLKLPLPLVNHAYIEALRWAHQVTKASNLNAL